MAFDALSFIQTLKSFRQIYRDRKISVLKIYGLFQLEISEFAL